MFLSQLENTTRNEFPHCVNSQLHSIRPSHFFYAAPWSSTWTDREVNNFYFFFCISACWYETHERAMLSDFTKTISQWNDHSSQPQITQLTFINEIAFNSVPSSLRRDHEKHQKKRATGECVEKVSCIDAGRGGVCSTHEKSRVEVFLSTFPNLATHSKFNLFLSLLTQFRSPTSDIWLSLAFLSLPADCRHMTWIDNRFFWPILIRTYQLWFHEERPEHEPLAIAHILSRIMCGFSRMKQIEIKKSRGSWTHYWFLALLTSLFFSPTIRELYDYFTSINNALTHCIRLCAAF